MTCDEIQSVLMDYINRKLSAEQNGVVVSHIVHCPHCLKELSEMIELQNLLQHRQAEIPDDYLITVFDKIPQTAAGYHRTSPLGAVQDTFKIVKRSIEFALQII